MVYSHTWFALNGLCNASLLKAGSWSTTASVVYTRLGEEDDSSAHTCTYPTSTSCTARFLTVRVPLVFCTLFRYAENALHMIEAMVSHQFPPCRLHLYQCAAVLFVSLGIRGTKRNIMNGLHLWFFSLVASVQFFFFLDKKRTEFYSQILYSYIFYFFREYYLFP